jgi:hypothetical protein
LIENSENFRMYYFQKQSIQVALTHVKQQQCVLFRTVKRICLCEQETEHREQKNNWGVD